MGLRARASHQFQLVKGHWLKTVRYKCVPYVINSLNGSL